MAVLTDDSNLGLAGFGGNSAIFFLFILFLFGGMGGGFGGWGGWGNNGFMNGWGSPMAQGTLTRADINEGFANNRILEKQDEITASLASNALNAQRDTLTSSYALRDDLGDKLSGLSRQSAGEAAAVTAAINQNKFDLGAQAAAIAASQSDKFCDVKSTVKDAAYATNSNISEAKFAIANSQCETNHRIDMESCSINRNVDNSRFETVKQTGEIINAIHADGELTRQLITGNVIQGLRDRLATAENTITSQAQVGQIVDRMRQTPTPSWMVQSPYSNYLPQVVVSGYAPSASYSYPGYGYGSGVYGNGIG